MSHDSGWKTVTDMLLPPPAGYVTEAECARRIKEAVKAEREACAHVAWDFDGFGVCMYAWPSHIAAAIRARQKGAG